MSRPNQTSELPKEWPPLISRGYTFLMATLSYCVECGEVTKCKQLPNPAAGQSLLQPVAVALARSHRLNTGIWAGAKIGHWNPIIDVEWKILIQGLPYLQTRTPLHIPCQFLANYSLSGLDKAPPPRPPLSPAPCTVTPPLAGLTPHCPQITKSDLLVKQLPLQCTDSPCNSSRTTLFQADSDCNITVLVFGKDVGYTVKYTPSSEGVPKGKAQGNS